eukprot:735409_1
MLPNLLDQRRSLIQSATTRLHVEIAETDKNRLANRFTSVTSGYSSESLLDGDTPSPHVSSLSNEEMIFYNNGYKIISTISDTLQGKLYKAAIINPFEPNKQTFVAIKQTSKYLFNQQIAIEDDINFCVSENIIKEILTLKYLTIDHQPIGDYIVKFISSFESDTDYYLVMEYIESETNLKQFVTAARKHIKNGKLARNQYQKMMKYLLWQLYVTVEWLHVMRCAHLDLCMENIMLQNASFIMQNNGELIINPKIGVKLVDFGVAELFDINLNANKEFLCDKQGLSIVNEGYFAPKVFAGEIYDARAADNFSLGMILFEVLTIGKKLYSPLTMYKPNSGYWSLYNNQLKEYLLRNNLLKYFNVSSYDLLTNLLNINEKQRLNGINILKHKFFKVYFARYQKQISKKFNEQNLYLRKRFPYYSMMQ